MPASLPDSPWRSQVPFHNEPTPNLVLACSDGRFARSFEDFAVNALKLDRFARLVVPGGPVFLAHDAADEQGGEQGLMAHLLFILDALRIERIHLIQHDLCAYYLQVVGTSDDGLRAQQLTDLDTAVQRLASLRPKVEPSCWLAGVEGESVVFSRVQP